MKVSINRNDIKNMVYESVKKCIVENLDIDTLRSITNGNGVDGTSVTAKDVFDAFERVYGQDAAREAVSARGAGMFEVIVNYINGGTPEQEQDFLSMIRHEGFNVNPGEIEFDGPTQSSLMESVDRVVDRMLREFDEMPTDEGTLIKNELSRFGAMKVSAYDGMVFVRVDGNIYMKAKNEIIGILGNYGYVPKKTTTFGMEVIIKFVKEQ